VKLDGLVVDGTHGCDIHSERVGKNGPLRRARAGSDQSTREDIMNLCLDK
jgi:hypothetical protein